jgi:hypothetical protein
METVISQFPVPNYLEILGLESLEAAVVGSRLPGSENYRLNSKLKTL